LGCPITLDSDIPDHMAFPIYAPTFTLDVPKGNMHDWNTSQYLDDTAHIFGNICSIIKKNNVVNKFKS
jgi:histone deacetylase 8